MIKSAPQYNQDQLYSKYRKRIIARCEDDADIDHDVLSSSIAELQTRIKNSVLLTDKIRAICS